jgi:hypothetical protein
VTVGPGRPEDVTQYISVVSPSLTVTDVVKSDEVGDRRNTALDTATETCDDVYICVTLCSFKEDIPLFCYDCPLCLWDMFGPMAIVSPFSILLILHVALEI